MHRELALREPFLRTINIKTIEDEAGTGFASTSVHIIGAFAGGTMFTTEPITKIATKISVALCLAGVCAMYSAAQAQPDAQAGAQLGEQSALAGKQAQGVNVEKTTEKSESGATSLAAGTTISAELTSSLDSKKLKTGDEVKARTTDALKSTDGRTILPRGAQLTGHITQASARGKGAADSSLGLVIDKAVLKNGQEIPLNVAIQAVAAPANNLDTGSSYNEPPMGAPAQQTSRGTMNGATPVGGPLNNTTAAAGGAVDNTVNSTTGGVAGNAAGNATGQLNANSRGVVGLNNLTLSAASGATSQGSLLTSTGKNVHLDSGTRLLLVAQVSASN